MNWISANKECFYKDLLRLGFFFIDKPGITPKGPNRHLFVIDQSFMMRRRDLAALLVKTDQMAKFDPDLRYWDFLRNSWFLCCVSDHGVFHFALTEDMHDFNENNTGAYVILVGKQPSRLSERWHVDG